MIIINFQVLAFCMLVLALSCFSQKLTTTTSRKLTTTLKPTLVDPCMPNPCNDEDYCVLLPQRKGGYKCCMNSNCNKGCKDPGFMNYSTRIPDPRRFDYRERVIYTCTSDYFGGGTIYCKDDGQWSTVKKCTPFNLLESPSNDFPVTRNDTLPTDGKIVEDNASNWELIAIIILIVIIVIAAIVGMICLWRLFLRERFYVSVPHVPTPTVEEPILPIEINSDKKLEENSIPVRNFAQHVALRHANTDSLFLEEFQEIENMNYPGITCHASMVAENKEKNRYVNITAYDHSRVKLQTIPRQNVCSDYINANYVSGYRRPKAYIACQGPMKTTIDDFWRMVWENKTTVIVMITNLVEKDKHKCDQYWPSEGQMKTKNLLITLKSTEKCASYIQRIFSLRNLKTGRRKTHSGDLCVRQYHYTEWPDHGTPCYDLPLLTFIKRSASMQTANSGPIVVHCSAGVGRTGTYIMLHTMMQMAKSTGKVNIQGFLKFIRSQRNFLVQTVEQYIFLHDALLTHLNSGDTECTAQQLVVYVNSLTRNTSNGNMANSDVLSSGNGHANDKLRAETIYNQFMKIAQFSAREIDYDIANRNVNQSKNRPGGVIPIFRSRVMLRYRAGKDGSDYINASYIQGYTNSRQFIVTQLPLVNTVADFWQLMWDQNCPTFITIRDKDWVDDIDIYWPKKSGDSVPSRWCNVKFSTEEEVKLRHDGPTKITQRHFILEGTDDDYVLEVKQLDISHWPTIDEISPQLTEVIEQIHKVTTAKMDDNNFSTVVQDRFGGTSAGQLVCIHSLHEQLANENEVDVYQTAKVVYQMRPHIFNSSDHILFIYKALLEEINPATPLLQTAKQNTNNGNKPIEKSSENGGEAKCTIDVINEKVSLINNIEAGDAPVEEKTKEQLKPEENVDDHADVSGLTESTFLLDGE